MATASYVIGIGSNRRHGRHGAPGGVVVVAVAALAEAGLAIEAISHIRRTPALGPSDRDFANAAVRIASDCDPRALLGMLKRIERDFGRRRGRHWGARVLDLDILAWSDGRWTSATLTIPHRALAERRFALGPAAEIAPRWRHPTLGATLAQLEARLSRRRAVDRGRPTP